MTKITLTSNGSGSGNVNFAAPNTNSTVTVTLPTSNVDMDALGPSTTLAAVGTYGLARQITGTIIYTHGHTRSGTGMEWADVNNGSSGAINVGTWRAMGRANNSLQSTLYLRIA
tara:strand:- start:71 stop:412 length:342 start_codon:yes stop_codon:yes gene_type:complete